MRRKGRSRVPWGGIAAAVVIMATLSAGSAVSASDTVSMSLFPPETFARNTGSPTAVARTFSVPATQGSFMLRVVNGDGATDNLVSSAVVKVNGVTILKTADFNQQVTSLERPVSNLVKGANTLEVEVRSIPTSSITVSIQGSYLLGVRVTDPLGGATISSDRATVQGTWVGYTNDVGIAVNGVAAAISGGAFVAADVPLSAGGNTVSATVTTFEGIKNSDNVAVTATGMKPSLALWANYSSGVSPLTVTFRPEVSGITPVEYRYDFDGDGVVDKTAATDEAADFVYAASGTYRARVTAVDSAGAPAEAAATVVVEARESVDALLAGRWNTLSACLQAQDVESSLLNFLPERREKYRAIFMPLFPRLPEIFASVSPPQLIAVEGNVAQYRVRREQMWEGVARTITYYVWFVRDADGLWRIDKF